MPTTPGSAWSTASDTAHYIQWAASLQFDEEDNDEQPGARSDDDFPYQTYFLPQAGQMLRALEKCPVQIVHNITANRYTPIFRGQLTMILTDSYETYCSATAISDHFAEHVRVDARRGTGPTPREIWTRRRRQVSMTAVAQFRTRGARPTLQQLRETVFRMCQEANQFSPTLVRGILTCLYGESVAPDRLHMLCWSAGWGDRLIAAIAYGYRYTGFDPHTRMRPVYQRIIDQLGDRYRQSVTTLPFEDATLVDNTYDVCIASPPFGDSEIYCQEATQCSMRYDTIDKWYKDFLLRALDKTQAALKPGGFLALHFADVPITTRAISIIERMLRFMESRQWQYEGIIGVNYHPAPLPVFVWRKASE